MKKKILGFTLIELLVVISLIGILAALAMVSYTASQKQARDTQRKSDLKQYQTVLETFASNNGNYYPSKTSATDITSLCATLGVSGNCPDDPRTPDQSYLYITNGTGIGNTAIEYLIWAQIEGSGDYWILCSSGKVGNSASAPVNSTCPI